MLFVLAKSLAKLFTIMKEHFAAGVAVWFLRFLQQKIIKEIL